MANDNRDDFARSVAVASLLTLAFAALLATLAILLPPSSAEQVAADPLVQLLDGLGGPWLVVAATGVVAIGWRRSWQLRQRDFAWALAGVAAAATIVLVMRIAIGPRLPTFVPSEESARPGITLGLAAGLIEEVVFRIVVLPVALLTMTKRLEHRFAAIAAVLVTAALFSLSHELGPAGGVFEPKYMLTRFLIPGVAMSAVALRLNMTFLVAAHCTAHLLIPSLLPG